MSYWALLLGQEEWRTFIKTQAAQLCVDELWCRCLNMDDAQQALAGGLACFQARNYDASERDIARALRIVRIIGDSVVSYL